MNVYASEEAHRAAAETWPDADEVGSGARAYESHRSLRNRIADALDSAAWAAERWVARVVRRLRGSGQW
jgi:hypothetical protein